MCSSDLWSLAPSAASRVCPTELARNAVPTMAARFLPLPRQSDQKTRCGVFKKLCGAFLLCKSIAKIRNVPFPRPCGATGNDAQKLHAPAFAHFRGAVLTHEVLCPSRQALTERNMAGRNETKPWKKERGRGISGESHFLL